MKAIVVGGGIGGLSVALSLHQAGIEARVYEAVRHLVPLGVGINLQPAAVRELTELGLGDELARTGIPTQALSCFNKFGQLIWSEPRGVAAGYNWPQYSIHRGQFQFVLLQALRERAGEGSFRSGLRLTSFEQNAGGVTASFRDDAAGTTFVDHGDILVGADGIHSTVRQQLYPREGEPRFAGQILWRAAVDAEPFLGGRTMIIAGHFDQRIVVYPIAAGTEPGQVLTNWICQITVPDSAMAPEDWNHRVSQERVLAAFDQWRFPWLDMPALIRRTPDIYEFPLVDRDPVQAWTFRRATLLGDAAHPVHPSGSQAGSQAVIDARALTGALLKERNPVKALERYEAERRPVLNDITLRNRRLGPEAALQLAEERAPEGFDRIEDVIAPDEIKSITDSFFAAAGLDVKTVNSRPPYVPANMSREAHPD
jgi:2-polyprenyl-6-methoxyphenol hydroxylase-like FAD-dependent oxidoreductase